MKSQFSILFLILLGFNAQAQLRGHFQSITVDDGLAQNTVWDILQDYRGYMWIATADGINRYDGYSFKHYKHKEEDTTTISGITDFRFFEDSNHQLWVMHDRGASLYNRTLDNFINIYSDTDICTIIGEDYNGRFWFLNSKEQLIAFSLKNYKIDSAISIKSDYPINQYRSSISLETEFILPQNTNHWISIDKKTLEVKKIILPSEYVGGVGKINDSTLCYFSKKYFYKFNTKSRKFSQLKASNEIAEIPDLVLIGYTTWNKKLYACGFHGIFLLDPENLTVQDHIVSFSKEGLASYHFVLSLKPDWSNNLWILTNGNGLKWYSPYRNKFPHYITNNVRTNMVKSICYLKDGSLVTGLFAEGMVIYKDPKNYNYISLKETSQSISNILAVNQYDRNTLILTQNNFLCLYDLQLKQITHKKYIGMGDDVPYPVLRKDKDENWIINNKYSLLIFDKKHKLKPLVHFNKSKLISTYEQTNDEKIWIGFAGGLAIYNKKTNTTLDLNLPYYVKSICVANNNKVYIATHEGLLECDSKGKLIHKYNNLTGLIDDFIYAVLEDKYGNIWFSHNKGLSRYNPNTGKFLHFGTKDGLQSNEFNTGSYYKDKQGLLYFGGVNGVNIIDPSNLPINPNIPQIAINEINLGDEPYKNDTSYNEIKKLILEFNQNTLSFDFSALEFSQPNQNMYAYFLEGYDKDWIESGTKHFARYANLPPGKYIFKIKAANGDGIWTPEPRELPITIIPPLWQRAWFIVIISFIGLLIISGTIWYFIRRQGERLRQELEVQHKLELERIRISRDLHDNVGAQLSYLITNMEWMAEHPEKLDPEEERKRLKSLSEAGRQAILTLRQTIWAISQQALSVEEFADRYKQYVLKMIEFNKQVHVKFEEKISTETQLSPAVALNLFRVCQEAFNNALKHSEAQNIIIEFYSDKQNVFKYVITDDGLGFDFNIALNNGHYGLKNMKARAEESQAKLSFETQVGKGTKVKIELEG